MCCKKYIKAPDGCGNQTNLPTHVPTPIMLSCNAATGQCVLDPKGSQSPGECIATCKSQAVQLQRGGGPVCAGPKRITVSRRVHRHLQVCRTAQLWPAGQVCGGPKQPAITWRLHRHLQADHPTNTAANTNVTLTAKNSKICKKCINSKMQRNPALPLPCK
jgi:hypothetical protein